MHHFVQTFNNMVFWSWLICLALGIIHVGIAARTMMKPRYRGAINPIIIICQLLPVINLTGFILRIVTVIREIPMDDMFSKKYQRGKFAGLNGHLDTPVNAFVHYWPGPVERSIAWVILKARMYYYYIVPVRWK